MAKVAKTKEAPSTKPLAKGGAVAFVSPKALQADIGEKAIKSFAQMKTVDNQINTLTEQKEQQKRVTLNLLFKSFLFAANNDKSIKLEHAVTGTDAEMKELREKLFVAVGLKQEIINEDGTKKIDWAPYTHEYFPHKEVKGSDSWRKKETFRSNFSAAFTKAMQAARGAQYKGITVQDDKATGAILISGKAVAEKFGMDQVLINEKQTVKDAAGTARKLKEIPSFTALAKMAHEGTGKELKTRVDSRAKTTVMGEGEILNAVKSLTTVVEGLKSFGDELAGALEALQDACADAIERNGEEQQPAA